MPIMIKLGNFVTGRWIEGDGDGQLLYNAVNGDSIASATTDGLDFESILKYAREKGNPALRKMTFQERGRMLRALALYLMEKKEGCLQQWEGVTLLTNYLRKGLYPLIFILILDTQPYLA